MDELSSVNEVAAQSNAEVSLVYGCINQPVQNGYRKAITIPNRYKEGFYNGLKNVCQEYGLKMRSSRKSRLSKKKGALCEKTTVSSYETHYRTMEVFCALKGDFESALMLQRDAPNKCFSMSSETVRLCVEWKLEVNKGVELTDSSDTIIRDVFGDPIIGMGGWNAPTGPKQFRSAMTAIHQEHGQLGAYNEVCRLCRVHHKKQGSDQLGCPAHRGSPLTFRRGSPTTFCDDTNMYFSALEKNSSRYVSNGASAITPKEMFALKELMVRNNDIEHYQFFVQFLCATMLFLRHDEYHQLTMESLQRDLCLIREDLTVDSLVFQIEGKRDKHPVNLTLWSNPDVPALCPVRHLLIYFRLIGIKKGFIFPTKKELLDRPQNGHYRTKIAYTTYLHKIKIYLRKITDRQDAKFGSHTPRKTGYLFAVWGNGEESEIRRSARHKDLNTSSTYRADAMYLLEMRRAQGETEMDWVSRFRTIYIQDAQFGMSLNDTQHNFKPLHELAHIYVSNMLFMSEKEVAYNLIPSIVKRSIEYRSGQTSLEILKATLKESIKDPEVEAKIIQVLNMTIQQRVHQLGISDHIANQSRDDRVHVHLPETKKKRGARSSGDEDLGGRHTVKNLSCMKQKVEKLLEIEKDIPSDKKTMTHGARTFCNNTLDPVLECFRGHCSNNMDTFVSKWKDSSFNKFKSKCSKKCHTYI